MLAPYPGGFASGNPRANVIAGAGFLRSCPDGLIVAHFGWGDPNTGLAWNTRTTDDSLLGIVAPTAGFWRVAQTAHGRIIRPGYQAFMYSMGDFWLQFADGAEPGALVYASLVDGAAKAGYVDSPPADAELTPWNVIVGCGPGGLAVISTWNKFT